MPEIGRFEGWLRGWFAGSGLDSFTDSLVRAEFFPVNALNAFLPLSLSLSLRRPAFPSFSTILYQGSCTRPRCRHVRVCIYALIASPSTKEHRRPEASSFQKVLSSEGTAILSSARNHAVPSIRIHLERHYPDKREDIEGASRSLELP